MTDAKVELGAEAPRHAPVAERHAVLRFRRRELFTDGQFGGLTGETHPRNSPSIANAAYRPALTWANPLLTTFEHQALVPMFGERPVELGFVGGEDELVARLENDADTPARFQAAFPDHADEPVSIATLTRALGAFQRTVVTGRSPYDRAVYGGEPAAPSDSPRRHGSLLAGRLECDHCHGGLDFSGAIHREGKIDDPPKFENNGLYNLDGHGAYLPDNPDLRGHHRPRRHGPISSAQPAQRGRHRALHARRLDRHAGRGRRPLRPRRGGHHLGQLAGDGARSLPKTHCAASAPSEKADLIAFLESLTDPELVSDPTFSPLRCPDAGVDHESARSSPSSLASGARRRGRLPRSRVAPAAARGGG
ncbi:MAG: cytochrome c peroxidase [bacterium]